MEKPDTEEAQKTRKRSCKKKKKARVKLKTRLKLLERAKKKDKKDKVKQYLSDWNKREESGWKFNKSLQIWLMKNWYKPDDVDNENFEIFQEYIAHTEGNAAARRKLVSRALNLIEDVNSNEVVKSRSKALIQLL